MFVPRSKRLSVPALIRELARKHPELLRPVTMTDALTIADRERILVAVVDLPERIPGRLIRVGEQVWIRVNRSIAENARAFVVMHELTHFWRDDPGLMATYMDYETVSPMEEFCDVFAWYVTSPAREFVLDREPF